MWDVPFEAGTLKAVGRKNNKIVCEETIQTTGTPTSIKLSVDKENINADARDAAHVKVEILDENGLTIPDANILITLDVQGTGNLIGFDNGNPADHASMKSNTRKTFNGLALAIVQSTENTGEIIIKATSPGLKDGSIKIKTN
jgi:beta-galactosidase